MGRSPEEMVIAFVPTAGGLVPRAPWVEQDRKALVEMGFQIKDVDIAGKTEEELREVCADVDCIFVAGGNTFYLLEQTRKSGFDKVIKESIAKDILYIGSSAGSVLLGPSIEWVDQFDDKSVAHLDSEDALGIVDFSVMPHDEVYHQKNREVMEAYKKKYYFIPLRNTEAVIVTDEGHRVI